MTPPSSDLLVRAASHADLDVLVEFNIAMARETEDKQLDRTVLRAGVQAILAESRRGFYRVAEASGEVVGCLMVTYEWSDWRNGDWWWLQSVYVRPPHRRLGVFRALYQHVERDASTRSAVVGIRLYVENENLRAQKTYAMLGMREEHYRMYGKPLRRDLGGNGA
ncbi:MAG: GNAT family N-acetyltransferase [Rudaea sp.]